jgi:hypothetical protein
MKYRGTIMVIQIQNYEYKYKRTTIGIQI